MYTFERIDFSAVSGPIPRVGDRVVCQMKPADGFSGQTSHKYYGFDVRSVQAQNDTRHARKKSISSPLSFVVFLFS